MIPSFRRAVTSFACALPLLVAGCMPARDGSDYKTYRAYDKETGEYFDVKVPYDSHYASHRGIVRDNPSKEEVEQAVDDATWKAESSASMDKTMHGGSTSTSSRGPFEGPSNEGPSPSDSHTPLFGNSYHDASSPFSR